MRLLGCFGWFHWPKSKEFTAKFLFFIYFLFKAQCWTKDVFQSELHFKFWMLSEWSATHFRRGGRQKISSFIWAVKWKVVSHNDWNEINYLYSFLQMVSFGFLIYVNIIYKRNWSKMCMLPYKSKKKKKNGEKGRERKREREHGVTVITWSYW